MALLQELKSSRHLPMAAEDMSSQLHFKSKREQLYGKSFLEISAWIMIH